MANAQLLAALEALYHHKDPSVKEQANQWLEQWQQSQEAWQGAHAVLQSPDAGLEGHYFAAQTLRTKVQRDYEELPPAASLALRDSLLSLLVRYAAGSPPVRTQLCLTVAALVTHLPAAQWGAGGALGWLTQRLGSVPAEASLPCMLELLAVLPQEAAGYQPALRPERRREVQDEMVAALPQALGVLGSCLGRAGERGREQALEAFAAWLKLSGGQGLSGEELSRSPLTAAALEGLHSADHFHAAADAVIELIYCTSHRGRPRPDMGTLVQAMVPRVMALRPRFHVATQQARAEREGRAGPEGEHDDGEEGAKAMARLFAEVGEAYTELIAGGSGEVLPPVEALLDVAGHPDDTICSMSFNFWHRLSRALTVGLAPVPVGCDPEPAPSEDERQRRLAAFRPYVERLVALIRGRVRFPDDFDAWHREERLDFKHARVAVGDTLMDAAAVLGGGETLKLLAEPLMKLSGGGAADWRTAEAALYCIRCVHRAAPPPGDPLLLALFAALPALPAPPPPLQYTVALTIGAYADWLGETARGLSAAEGPRLLGSMMDVLIRGLRDPDSAGAAAISMRRLCDGCSALLSGSVAPLLQLYRQVQVCGDVAEGGDDAFALDEDDVGQLVEAVALVVSALPDGERQRCVQQMLDVVVQPMQRILGAPAGDPGAGAGAVDRARLPLVLPLAERVTTIFRAVRDPGDVAEALLRLWPWLEAALDAFGQDVVAAEKLCKAPRYAVRSAGKAAAPAVPRLAAALPRRFEATGHSCYLYIASELVKTFGDAPQHDGELGPMLARMLLAACTALRTLGDVTAKPDIADDVFLLAGRGLSYAPRLLITTQLLPALLGAARAGLLVQHREACCSIAAFLVRLLDPATHRKCAPDALAHLQASLTPHAPQLVRLLLAGAAGALPPSRVPDLNDVLYALLKVAAQSGVAWATEGMAALPADVATPADRQRFLAACQRVVAESVAVEDERLLLDALTELSELCRRSRRTQAAAQRALLPAELQYIVR